MIEREGEILIDFLRKSFISDYENVKNQKVRQSYGKLASYIGIIINFILFCMKSIIGILVKSVAILGDSVNNLSDMGSSIVTLVGFKVANKPADQKHPYGHQRMEYIAGLIVAILVIFVGGSLLFSSIGKILHYQHTEADKVFVYITIGILVFSILLKVWQGYVNRRLGKWIDSVALKATAYDSFGDVISTTVILIGNIVLLFVGDLSFSLDGILGILVSIFIIFSGGKMIHETTDLLIGEPVSKEYVSQIIQEVKKFPVVLGVHDVVCHPYGPTTCFITMHIEVDSRKSILDLHTQIDEIETTIDNLYGVDLTIHLDPVEIENEEVNRLKKLVGLSLKKLNEKLDFHDLRMITKNSVKWILFDVMIPYKFKISNEEITEYLKKEINQGNERYELIIHFDHQFVKE